MALQFYRLLGHSIAAADGFTHSSDLIVELKKGGTSKELLSQATALMHQGEELITQKTESCGEDRIREHGLHFATDEAEMWLQTVRSRAKKAGLSDETMEKLLAPHLHSHDHAATVIAKCMRCLATIASAPEVAAVFGNERHVKDVLIRGNAALTRLIKSGEIKMRVKEEQDYLTVFQNIEDYLLSAEKWFWEIQNAALSIKTPEYCGWLGIVPEGKGLAIGGASFAVTLHGRGQTDPPSQEVKRCTGWSIGRQGNSENLGSGFLK